MFKSEKLKSAMNTLQNVNIQSVMKEFKIIKEQTEKEQEQFIEDVSPIQLVLDAIVEVSQETKEKKVRKVQFKICDKWLKPNNVFSVVATSKDKKQGNIWILFFDSNTWYIRKGLKAASTVHVKLISKPAEQE